MRTQTVQTKWGRDHYMMIEAGELSSVLKQHESQMKVSAWTQKWAGETVAVMRQRIVTGHDALVEQSDRFYDQIADQVPMSRGWSNVDDVVGAVPNVPAFLAGQPQCMRRRQRTAKENAPLTIYMDLTSSSTVSQRDVLRRGLVLLALTRMLVQHRSVELWVGAACSVDQYAASTIAWRIDTAPLDTARAAYHISSPAMSRLFAYGVMRRVLGAREVEQTLYFPFRNYQQHVQTAEQRMRVMINGDMLFIPPLHGHDPMLTDPVGWLRRTMSRYVRQEE